MLRLKRINKNNWEDCVALRVSREQKKFIAANLYSIAEAQFLPGFKATGIYLKQEMIGFALYGIDPDDGNYWLYRLMIDKAQQRQGHARIALQEIIKTLAKGTPAAPKLMVGYHVDNLAAHRLYESVGFRAEGLAPWGEKIAGFHLASPPLALERPRSAQQGLSRSKNVDFPGV
ncbi:GNAT family N-acetyltransferase [Rugamonas rubra]|uniref:Diamine N-acetyltransferase n=1 Tax=Rugamonas rubra TaxID=758825 RepID=A0A1I4U4X6_9BURK|nr:GNAT family N-acetyltransferase [Rugamonas rubra]SFM83969.1 diamine N-acetyltransferase [Rugamonas rubra]